MNLDPAEKARAEVVFVGDSIVLHPTALGCRIVAQALAPEPRAHTRDAT